MPILGLKARVLGLTSLLAIAVLIACGDEEIQAPDSLPPEVIVNVQVRELAGCPFWLELLFDAAGSTDDVSLPGWLLARWDQENDGTWDTDWQQASLVHRYVPEMEALLAVDSTWTTRCQVRDEAGNVSDHVEVFDIGPMPTAPDLILTSLEVPDTVRVGSIFSVIPSYLCWGMGTGWSYEARYLRDGNQIEQQTISCSTELCVSTGRNSSIDEPGHHMIAVVLDPDNLVAEEDETNNVMQAPLTVIP